MRFRLSYSTRRLELLFFFKPQGQGVLQPPRRGIEFGPEAGGREEGKEAKRQKNKGSKMRRSWASAAVSIDFSSNTQPRSLVCVRSTTKRSPSPMHDVLVLVHGASSEVEERKRERALLFSFFETDEFQSLLLNSFLFATRTLSFSVSLCVFSEIRGLSVHAEQESMAR